MKREAGASPARTRRCKVGALFHICHWCIPGRRNKVMITEPEDLPMMVLGRPRVIG